MESITNDLPRAVIPLRELAPLQRNGSRLWVRGSLLVAGVLMVSILGGWTRRVRATSEITSPRPEVVSEAVRDLTARLEASQGELTVAKIQIERHNQIYRYSSRYQIPADLAAAIYDIALSEGVDPAIGFRLVKVESNFDPRARSSAGAIGFTQIRPPTARFFEAGLSESQMYDRDVNLRVGFRFLRSLMRQYNDLELALVAYNRGPAKVQEILNRGGDPANGYAEQVLKGTKRGRNP